MKHNLFSPSPWGKGVNKSCVSPSFRREDTSLKTRSALLSSVFFMKFYISRNKIHFTVSSVININAGEKPWSHFGMFSSEAFNSWLINLNLWSRNDSFLQDYWFVMDIQKCGGWGSVLCGTTATWTFSAPSVCSSDGNAGRSAFATTSFFLQRRRTIWDPDFG